MICGLQTHKTGLAEEPLSHVGARSSNESEEEGLIYSLVPRRLNLLHFSYESLFKH